MKKLFTTNPYLRTISAVLGVLMVTTAAIAQSYHLSGDFNGFSTSSDIATVTGGAVSITKTGISGANNFKIGYNGFALDWSKGSGVNFNQTEQWFQPNGSNMSATFTAGRFYTFNLPSTGGSGGNRPSGVMETTFNPTLVTSVAQNTNTDRKSVV